MGKLITNKTVQLLMLQALIAILVAACNTKSAHAAPYTVFGADSPRGALTNSNAARAMFQASVFNASVNTMDTLTAGDRNAIFTEALPAVSGTRDIQYGLAFAPGGSTVYARSSRITETYLFSLGIGLIQTGSTTPQYDDLIVTSGDPSFAATPVSGANFMGSTNNNLRFDFATNADTGGDATTVKAFGFYGIDAGDTATNNLSVTVTYLDSSTQNFVVKPGGFSGTANDNTFFFGIVTPDQAFRSVVINNPASATDRVGYDNFMIGTSVSATVVPEKSSLTGMLIGCSLCGLILMRKRTGDV